MQNIYVLVDESAQIESMCNYNIKRKRLDSVRMDIGEQFDLETLDRINVNPCDLEKMLKWMNESEESSFTIGFPFDRGIIVWRTSYLQSEDSAKTFHCDGIYFDLNEDNYLRLSPYRRLNQGNITFGNFYIDMNKVTVDSEDINIIKKYDKRILGTPLLSLIEKEMDLLPTYLVLLFGYICSNQKNQKCILQVKEPYHLPSKKVKKNPVKFRNAVNVFVPSIYK